MERRTLSARSLLAAALVYVFAAMPATANEPLNINKATAEQIATTISGVGLKKAQAIVSYRAENGPFKDLDALTNVSGIGATTVAQNRERLRAQ
jgi:competence protein ComEA